MASLDHDQMTEREELDFRVMRALASDPEMSQRQIAQMAGISLGAVNYCLKALAEKGLVKVKNFRASNNKMRYAYVLTPQGITGKAQLTRRFITHKLEEYIRIGAEIESAKKELEIE
jgi:EPS-associated MarR family transcriptional regulator